jgi:GNAT superfamily N-acetyltransferase
MQVRQLDLDNRQDVEQFVQFPFALYRGDPYWVPPLRSEMRTIMNRGKHPFYQHSEADFFVVEAGGQTLGRIAALENRNFNDFRGQKAAFFGYFEIVEDPEAAQLLFQAVFTWAKSRGLTEMIGPRGVIGIDGSVLVEGFDRRPAIGIPYNRPYYDGFIRAAGFAKDTDYLSGYIPADIQIPERLYQIAERVKKRRGFWLKEFRSKAEIRRWIPQAMAVHRQAMGELHTFYPPTEAETQMVIGSLLMIVDPHLIKLVMKGDEIAGFILGYPDITDGLRRMNGRVWPTGWFHALRERRRTRWANVNGLGLLPEYRGLGANALLYTELDKTIKSSRYEHIDVVQVNETNFKSRSDMERLGVQWYKRHRHYRRKI